MSATSDKSDAWLDAQLRDVPLPPGLLRGLRQISAERAADEFAGDEAWDAAAATAWTPEGEGLDEQMRRVPLPAGLRERLHAIAGPARGWEAELADVPLPEGYLQRLVRISRFRPRRMPFSQLAAAASLLMMIGLSYIGAMGSVVLSTAPEPVASAPRLETWTAATDEPANDAVIVQLPAPQPVAEAVAAARSARPVRLAPLGDEAAPPAPPRDVLQESMTAPGAFWLTSAPAAGGDWGDIFATGVRPQADELPELVPLRGAPGLQPPRLRGFDWLFYLEHDEWPVIGKHPRTDRRLWTTAPPLVTGAESFYLTGRYLAERELPPPRLIRKEEFLAALDYEFPRPQKAALGIRTAGGPSPFGDEPGLFLLQVAVQARDLPDRNRPPAHLVLAVDVSDSMAAAGRLEIVRRALRHFVPALEEGDLLSLVAFNQDAEVLVEHAAAEHAADLQTAFDSLHAGGATNLVEGLSLAYRVATDPLPGPSRRGQVVLFSDGPSGWDPQTVAAMQERLAEAARLQGVRLTVVDLAEQPARPDAPLPLLAAAGEGKLVPAATFHQVRAALAEALTGRPQLVARDAALQVTFHPRMVEAYRLIGHEASRTRLLGIEPGESEAAGTFYAGQWATALYEIKLQPVVRGGNSELNLLRDTVATARLTWRSPDGTARRATQRVSDLQFARSFAETAVPLQMAALAAETAEVLCRSAYAQGSSLARVLERSLQVNYQLEQRRSFVDFMALVEKAADRRRP